MRRQLTSHTRFIPKWDITVGAKVNSRIVSRCVTSSRGGNRRGPDSKDSGPSRDWHRSSRARARNRIKHYINQKEREDAAELGRNCLRRKPENSRRPGRRCWEKKNDGRASGPWYPKVGDPIRQVSEKFATPDLSPLFPSRPPPEGKPSLRPGIGDEQGPQAAGVSHRGQGKTVARLPVKCEPDSRQDIVGTSHGERDRRPCHQLSNLDNLLGSGRTTEVERVDMPGEDVHSQASHFGGDRQESGRNRLLRLPT